MDLSKRCRWRALFSLNTLLFCIAAVPVLSFHERPLYYLFYLGQAVLFSGLLGLCFLPVLHIRHKLTQTFVLLLLEAVGLIYIFINAKVYCFWHLFINHSLLHLYFSKGGGAQVFEISLAMYVWIAVAITLWIIISLLALLTAKLLARQFSFKYVALFLILVYVAAQGLFFRQVIKDDRRTLQSVIIIPYFYETSWVGILHVFGVQTFPKKSLSAELQSALATRHRLNYPQHPLHYHLPAKPLNVLFIVVDTLRYDMVNPVNMPNVYRFSKRMSDFEDNISGGDCTRAGIFSMFYGIPATNWAMTLREEKPSIIVQAFQANHYDLKILGSAPLLAPPFYHNVFVTVPHLQLMTKGDSAIPRDARVNREMNAFLKQEATSHHPFFGFIFYDAPHAYNAIDIQAPFLPAHALNYFAISNKTNPKPIFNLYKNAVFYDDHLIQTLLTTLKQKHLLKNTVVILTSDHGQEFNEYHNDYWEHASGFSKYQVHTPLLVAWPGMKPKKYTYQTTHFDFAPTLLKRVLGVRNPAIDYAVGDDLFSKQQPKFVVIGNYAYYAVVANHQVLEFHDSGLYRLYNSHMKPLPNADIHRRLMGAVIKQIGEYS